MAAVIVPEKKAREKKSLAQMLRNYARSRGYRTARGVVIIDSGCSHYWDASRCYPLRPTREEWTRLARLSERYNRLCHYYHEVVPQWKVVDTVYYADNSTEVIEEATAGPKKGQRRQRMTCAPGGDACC